MALILYLKMHDFCIFYSSHAFFFSTSFNEEPKKSPIVKDIPFLTIGDKIAKR